MDTNESDYMTGNANEVIDFEYPAKYNVPVSDYPRANTTMIISLIYNTIANTEFLV